MPPTLGQPIAFPNFQLLSGEQLTTAHFQGHVTVIYWWASWCPFCREQTPHVQALWDRYSRQGLRVLGISIDRKPELASAYLKKGGFTFPSSWFDDDLSRVFARPRVIPVTVVVDRSGKVVEAIRGQMFPEDIAGLSRWL